MTGPLATVLGLASKAVDVGVPVLIGIAGTIYDILEKKAGMSAAEIHAVIQQERAATHQALVDAEAREKEAHAKATGG